MKKRTLHILVTAVLFGTALISMRGPLQHAQGAQEGANAGNVAAPTDKAAYFSHGDMLTIWKDLETRQVNNHRLLAGKNHVLYVRIVRTQSPAIVHSAGADVWVCEEGSAVAVTGGKLVNPKDPVGKDPNSIFGDTTGTSIEGGTEQAFTPGDILYVPPGVAHTFKDMKGFRAYLIRFDVK
jgi:hypothetical protein